MIDNYVGFKTSKLLKKKGFDEICDLYYPVDGGEIEELDLYELNYCRNSYIKAPTQETVIQWLLDVHNIHIEPTPYVTTEGFYWAYKVLRLESGTDMCVRKLIEKSGFDTKSEAVEDAITKCLMTEL